MEHSETGTREGAAISCTIAIPVFNRRDLVKKALESALAESIDGLEILVSDNRSDDGTWEALQCFEDPRLRLVRNDTNLGLFGNFNRCLELARGDYLRFLCSDDRLVAGSLEQEIRIMKAHPDVVLVTTDARFVDEGGNSCNLPAIRLKPGIYSGSQAICSWFRVFSHYGYNPLNYPSGVLFRTDVARRAGGFHTDMRLAADVNFYFRVLEFGMLASLDRVGCEIMLHSAQEQVIPNLSGIGMREHFSNVERFRDVLATCGQYRNVRRYLAGVVLGEAWHYRRRGLPAAAQAHFDIVARSGVGWIAATLAICCVNFMRWLLKATGLRMIRLPVPRPFQF
jgi:glycosyltransferase involved in cell wall biosynthesis